MTREEAKTVFLNRGYVEVEGGTIYDADKWREACRVISEWLEQQPTITSTNNSGEMIYPQVDGIIPTVVEPLPNVEKEVEKYKKMLKHPVIKSIMGMDETQEQLDFVQSHKKIPVTLTVQKEKTCDGCLFQQYPRITVCQECSRYYSDNYVKE